MRGDLLGSIFTRSWVFSYLFVKKSRTSDSLTSSSRSDAMYFTAYGARLHAVSCSNDVRSEWFLPHGDLSEEISA